MVVLTKEALEYIKIFITITKAEVRHCLVDKCITFVVETHQAGKAVGKNGINVRRLSSMFRKPIKIIEFNEDKTLFIKNLLFPIIPKDIVVDNNKITIISGDNIQRGKIYGRERNNLKRITEMFNIDFKGYEIAVN